MSNKYYYKFQKNSEVGKQMTKFWRACQLADFSADRYAKRMGALFYYSEPTAFAGGVSYLVFDNTKNVDIEQWRLADTIGNDKCFEPNCYQRIGCSIVQKGFKPSNTATIYYQKEQKSWEEVKKIYSLKQWASMINLPLSDDEELNESLINKHLSNKQFLQYIEYYNSSDVNLKGNKTSRGLRRAIRAERERMNLPVVSADKLYNILKADLSNRVQEEVTPLFFIYNEEYYLCVNYPCVADGIENIHEAMFIKNMNMAKYYAKVAEDLKAFN